MSKGRMLPRIAALAICLSVSLAASAETDPKISTVEHGLRPAARLEGEPGATYTIDEAMRDLHVPGVVVVVIHDGRIAWAKGYGVAADGRPVTAETLFQAGSVSKSVAAVAALQLAQSGKLTLDGNVDAQLTSWHLPATSFTATHPVTLRGLLSHTAGVNVPWYGGYAAGEPVPTLQQVLEGKPPANSPPVKVVSVPGSVWIYSGGGYEIVQQLVADLTGAPFENWARDHLFAPAGMRHSQFDQALPKDWSSLASVPHDAQGKPVAGGAHRYPEMAAAGLWTTGPDLARFLIDLQQAMGGERGHLLSPKMARGMLEPIKPGHAMGFDIGGSSQRRYFFKGGDTIGYACAIVAYAKGGDGAVVMTNASNGHTLTREIFRGIASAYAWPDFQPQPRKAIADDPQSARRIVGHYDLGSNTVFTIRIDAGHPVVVWPGSEPERLYPESATRWFTLSDNATYSFDEQGNKVVSGNIQQDQNRFSFVVSKSSSPR